MNTAAIYGPDPIHLEGRTGSRYWVHHDYEFTGNAEVDARLSGYPVAVFQPVGRMASDTPIVISLQGIAAPYQLNSFIIPTLLDMGICCVLFDAPLGGERSLTRTFKGDSLIEAQAFRKHGVPLSTGLVLAMMDAVGRDFATIIRLIQERHGLVNDRIALLGFVVGGSTTPIGSSPLGIVYSSWRYRSRFIPVSAGPWSESLGDGS